jgi:DNA-binding transcriptional ArsR family regulator
VSAPFTRVARCERALPPTQGASEQRIVGYTINEVKYVLYSTQSIARRAGSIMAHRTLTPELLELIAARFRVLAEPTRLQLLEALRGGAKTVTELMVETGLRQANVSKHLQVLYAAGFVDRQKVGLHVYYRVTDAAIFDLCSIMCDRLKVEVDRRRAVLTEA